MRFLALLLAALALGSAACGGRGEEPHETNGTTQQNGSTQTNGSTQNGTTDTVQDGAKVGRITDLEKPVLLIDQTRVNTLADLFVGDVLETDETGLIHFALDAGSECQMLKNVRVRVGEKEGVVVPVFLQGLSLCRTPSGQGSQEYGAGDTTILARDSVFGVSVEDGAATVKVTYGCVDVAGAGGGTVSVGPEQQVVVSAGGTVAPDAIMPAQLSRPDRERLARLGSVLPGLEVGTPAPGNSDALAKVVRADSLVVAVDPGDSSAESFGQEFADSLAKAWGVDVTIRSAPAEDAARQLAEGQVDVVLTPSDVQGVADTAAAPVPLFEDTSGQTWELTVADETFASSLREYLAADVRTGEYARRYKAAIGEAVTYEPVVPVADC